MSEVVKTLMVYLNDLEYLFQIKPLLQNPCVLGSIKQMDLSEFLMEQDLLGYEKYDAIFNRVRYPIDQKSSITYVLSDNNTRFKVDSYDSLSLKNNDFS